MLRLAAPPTKDSIVDGPGLRTTIWLQGCPHHCPHCHNPQTHKEDGGYLVHTEELIEFLSNITYQDGVTFSGGDPLLQAEALIPIADWCHAHNLTVWCYTGYIFDPNLPNPLYPHIDVLVDGPYIHEKRSMDLPYRGSSNQRIIDVQNSLKERRVVLWTDNY